MKGARFPVPSVPHPPAGPPARQAPEPAKTKVGRRWLHWGLGVAPLKTNGNGGCGSHASRVCSASAPSLGSGKRTRLHRHQGAPSAADSPGRLAHPRFRLTPAARSRAGAGRCKRAGGDAGDSDPRCAARAGRSTVAPGAAEREAASQLLARCRLKPVWSGQVVARQPPGSAPGPPRFQAADASGSPTPLPPPSPPRSFSGLFSPLPSSSGSWAGPCVSRLQR